jgi:hypothetical protein
MLTAVSDHETRLETEEVGEVQINRMVAAELGAVYLAGS